MNYRSQRTVDGVVEHGYYIDNNDMTNKVIQMDSPYNYADIGTGTSEPTTRLSSRLEPITRSLVSM